MILLGDVLCHFYMFIYLKLVILAYRLSCLDISQWCTLRCLLISKICTCMFDCMFQFYVLYKSNILHVFVKRFRAFTD